MPPHPRSCASASSPPTSSDCASASSSCRRLRTRSIATRPSSRTTRSGRFPTLVTDDGDGPLRQPRDLRVPRMRGRRPSRPARWRCTLARARRPVARRRHHGRGGAGPLRDGRATGSVAVERLDHGPAREGHLRARRARSARRRFRRPRRSRHDRLRLRAGLPRLPILVTRWRDTRPQAAAWYETFGARDSMVATRPT